MELAQRGQGMARRSLTDKGVEAITPRAKMYSYSDPALPSFHVRVMPSGVKSFVAVAKDPRGKQIWTTIGKTSGAKRDEA
jgi:hypothetical protein